MVATQETLTSLLQRFNADHHVRGSAVVTRDGLPLVSALPASVNRETFAAMTATMLGAAETAASEVERTAASSVTAEFGTLRLIAVGAGLDLIVVTIADGARAAAGLEEATRALADQVRQGL